MAKTTTLIVLGLLFFGIASCGTDTTDVEHIAKARHYLDAGDMASGIIELKGALQKNGENFDTRYMLGEAYYSMGDVWSAEKELSKALELGDVDGRAVQLLAQIWLILGKTEELESIPMNQVSPQVDAAVLSAQGLAQLYAGNVEQAQSLISEAMLSAPSSSAARTARATLLFSQGENSTAIEELEAVNSADPTYGYAWSLRGSIERTEGQLEEAVRSYGMAVDSPGYQLSAYQSRALILIAQGKYDEASEDIDFILKRLPDSPGANYARGLILYRQGNYEQALHSFTKASINESTIPLAVFYVASCHYQLRNFAQAEQYAGRFFFIEPDVLEGRLLLAAIRFDQKRYEEAEKLLRPLTEQEPVDERAINLLADVLLNQGKTGEAVELLEISLKARPDSAFAHARLGLGLLATGENARVVSELEAAVSLDPTDLRAGFLLVLHYMRKRNYDESLVIARKMGNQNPSSPLPDILSGQIMLVQSNSGGARQAFVKALEKEPGNPAAAQRLATLAMKDNDRVGARRYYESILKYHKDHYSTLLKVAALDVLEKKDQEFLGHIQRALTTHPNAVQPRLVLARYYLFKGEPEKVTGLFAQLDSAWEENVDVLSVLSTAKFQLGEFSEARISLESLAKLQPDKASTHYLLARVYAELKNQGKTRAALSRTLELSPGHFPARLSLARLLLLQHQLDQAKEQLKILLANSPEHPDVLQLGASLARVEGDFDRAVEFSERALDESHTLERMRLLARQKREAGDFEGALRVQELWMEDHPLDRGARLDLAYAYANSDRIEDAVIQFELALKEFPDDVMALNYLAWYLKDTDRKRALSYAARANEQMPGNPFVLDIYSYLMMQDGNVKEASRLNALALKIAPDNHQIRYHQALIDARSGERAAAIATLKTLTEPEKNFADKADAIKLLKELQAKGG